MVEGDEGEVEKEPNNLVSKDGVLAEDWPSIIFFSSPQGPGVATLTCEIESQAESPDGNQACSYKLTRISSAIEIDCPSVDARHDTPQFVDLTVVSCGPIK